MATTFKIYFTNYSGFNNNFAFFSALPEVVNSGESPVYGNVIASQFVPNDKGDTTFEIDVTLTYYAWTSVSPVDVKTLPGQNVVTRISNSKLAQLGTTDSPGSTFNLIDQGGNPTFAPPTTFEAPPGTFQISSKPNAFQPAQNFICGLGSVDGNGQRIPVATFAAQPNTVATITPIVKFYIAQFSAVQGTVIDVTLRSNQAAKIDFTGTGLNAAFIKQVQGGGWDITYGTAKAMSELAIAERNQTGPGLQPSQDQTLRKALELLQNLLEVQNNIYSCKLTWTIDDIRQRAGVVQSLLDSMRQLGYTITPIKAAASNPAPFKVESNRPVAEVRVDWATAVDAHPAVAKDPKTIDANMFESQVNGSNGHENSYDNEDRSGNPESNGDHDTYRSNGRSSAQLDQLLKMLSLAAH
ncbi:hypothetical protein BDP55DRAFT_681271 [Colletotrichum godetiae]|uniref:Uncharacterized protein n=1 Tax=Colletotrichum godetiae TaxID=1209918 RepID=A0AAJ0A9E9_9PEZI|nr:uncharacterized protein BDP55DRAFT_681271 [Colletotrichum godetiae]KAK1658932.1 hypothetical protein BDP55DRAFT_681271 [Colletotrichum godetiae]